MEKLLMISGDRSLAEGKHGAFYNTLEEFHKYWDCIDIICPKTTNNRQPTINNFFGNVFIHSSPWPLILQPLWILKESLRILKNGNWKLENGNWIMTVHEYPPFYNGIGAWIISVFTKIPYVLEIMHIPGHPKATNFKERFYKLLTKIFIRFDANRAKTVRVINKKETSEFLIKAGVPRQKLVYIPAFYIDLNIFKPKEIRKEYDLIFVGRLAENKGVDLLLETASKLKTQILNLKMIIVGNGPLENDLKLKIKNLKLQDSILLHGWAKDSQEIAELMNKSKILIMPSFNEGGPRVVLEAMACGVPVLATPVGIVPDVIKDGESGVIISWQSDDIASKTRELLSNLEKYSKYSQTGIKIAEQFEKEATIRNYADKLKEILG